MPWDRLRPILLRAGVPSDLFESVREVLAATAPQRGAELDRLAAAADEHADRLVQALAGDGTDARHAALDLAARLPAPLVARTVRRCRVLLRDRRLPAASRLAAAVALTRTTGPDGSATVRVLRDFAAGFGKARAIERAGALRRRFGDLPAFGSFLAYLRRKVKLSCPQCREKLPRRAMVRHLWDRHGALLVGRQTTTPGAVIDTWGGADPERGLQRLHRWMLRHGLGDAEAGEHLRQAASGATLCPACFAITQLPADPFPIDVQPLAAMRGRLAADGYVVEVSDRGLYPRLHVATPRTVLFAASEPGARLSHHATLWLIVAPWIALALVLAVTAPLALAPLLTAIALTVAFVLRLSLRLRPKPTTDPTDRVVRHAWALLVPRLHADGFDPTDAAFLARLAVTSIGRGDPKARDATVQRFLDLTPSDRPAERAALVRLAVADATATGGDPAVRLADAIRPCFTVAAPAALAELVLADERIAGWTPGQRARLRMLLAARAFETGLEVADLHDLGRAAPALGQALGSADTDGLARLRLLWNLRPARPWAVCGPAATVFELANYPMLAGQHLETAPDLLLYQPLTADGEPGPPAPLLMCGRGLLYRDVLIHDPKSRIDAEEGRSGYQLVLGRHRLPCRADPADVARKLARWARYYFQEFLPQTDSVLRNRAADARGLLRPRTVTCPKCGVTFMGRRGDVGERL